ncbi:hypothetical protein XELAEV_18029324mg [Xenopus laevis]|uniref:Helix-turn-helix domain-containing protein n=1 Tax=Xenopus laevis TaxID=8355 RepID=A0A974CRS5_XENLA|nr:hypothetical protein XELAEV_18029324mg [Xenopus laevis]
MNFDSSKLEFLDIEIKKDAQGLISTNLFRKKTASNSLLHAKSMHPFKCIEGIPKGQYIQLRRICSSDEDFKHEAYKLYQREDLLYKPNKSRSNKSNIKNQGQTRFILTYNNNDADIRNTIYKHWDILSKNPTLGQLVTSRPLFTYKKNTSIGNLLTRSHFQKQPNKSCCKTLGSFRCGDCEQCRFIKPSKMFGKTGLEFKMYHYTCCTTTHVIYLFTCHCGSLYVGKTKRPLKRPKTWIFKLNTYKSELGLNVHLNFQAFI